MHNEQLIHRPGRYQNNLCQLSFLEFDVNKGLQSNLTDSKILQFNRILRSPSKKLKQSNIQIIMQVGMQI